MRIKKCTISVQNASRIVLRVRKWLRRPELSNTEVVAPDEEGERISCVDGITN